MTDVGNEMMTEGKKEKPVPMLEKGGRRNDRLLGRWKESERE